MGKCFVVPEEVLNLTRLCPTEMGCLKDEAERSRPLCPVVFVVAEHATVVDIRGDKRCPYAFDLGTSGICSCPTRYAIYMKYGV